MEIFRRNFLKLGAAGAGAGLLAGTPSSSSSTVGSASAPGSQPEAKDEVTSVSIREYLITQARGITKGALSDFQDPAAFRRSQPERRRQFMEMMGLDGLPPIDQRTPLNVQVTGVLERPGYRIEKLYYESLPKLYVTANLYIPKPQPVRAPGVLYVLGHGDLQKVELQTHGRRFAELGFVCLVIDTLEDSEERGQHHGPYLEGWFHWYSRGYTPNAIETLNGIRGLDLLASRPEVDASRLGLTGISGGGARSWSIAACDGRVKVTAPVCGTATLDSHIYDLTLDGHCDCMWWTNTYKWDLAQVGALIAPRPVLIASADHDRVFTIDSIHEVHDQLAALYRALGVPDNLRLVVNPGGHGYKPSSRTAVFSWFVKHLQGKDVPPDQVGDVETAPEKLESEETLRVFVNGSPAGNRTTTIQDDFIVLPKAPEISDPGELEKHRGRVIAGLRSTTFAAFPKPLPPLDLRVEHQIVDQGHETAGRFAFTSEAGWRLHGWWSVGDAVTHSASAVVALRSRDEPRNGKVNPSDKFLRQLSTPMFRIIVEPRGTGETAWGDELQWHLRRATAWTGTTLASLWVFDTLRALEAVRKLDQVQGRPIALAARGEMAAVALYAALLDGHVRTLFLESPAATQDAPSQKDGGGPAIEMLSCLRITDLPQVAGLLFPTELVFVGESPSTYDWAEQLYARLGSPARFQRVKQLSDWRATA